MSAGAALAAIEVIHSIVSKVSSCLEVSPKMCANILTQVKDNKDELKSLSRRLQVIVQALEESRGRDVLRDTEYEDSLSAVFE